VLKDVILVAAAMVVTAGSFRGGRLVRADPTPAPVPLLGGDRRADAHGRVEAREKLDVILSTIGGSRSIDEVCQERGISPDTYHAWRETVLSAATDALQEPATPTSGAPLRSGR